MADLRELTLIYPGMPHKYLRGNAIFIEGHIHEKRAEKNNLKEVGYAEALSHQDFQVDKCLITYRFYKAGVLDLDNFAIGFKALIDGLRQGGMFPDDNAAHVMYGIHEHVRVPRKDERTEIFLQEM